MGGRNLRREKYLLHIKTGTIHSAVHPCGQAKRMKKSNGQYFERYEDAVNFFEGDKKGTPCALCLKEKL